MSTTIGLSGSLQDPQTKWQAQCLVRMGARLLVLDPQLVRATLRWRDRQVGVDGAELDDVQAWLVRSLPPTSPGADAFAGGELDWPTWWQLSCLQRDAADSALSLLLEAEGRGAAMFNPPSRALLSRRKPYQLACLRRAGCAVPRTLVTNDRSAAQSFVREVDLAIVKPAGGGALTRDAATLSEDEWASLDATPAIFQERIVGDDVRVMVLDGVVISAALIELAAPTLDFRGDVAYQRGQARYREVALPAQVQAQCARAASALGLRFTGLDLKVTADGRYVLLECNNSPIYLDVERKLGHPITELLCAALLRARPPAP